MKRIVALLIAATVFLTACAGTEKMQENQTEQEEEVSIGLCFDTFVVERWLKDRDVFTYTATELGKKVEVQNANGNVEKQREQIQHFIDIGVEAIVIVAVDADAILDLLETAHEKKIKIIAYDRLIEDTYVDLYITFDNYQVGTYMADAIEEGLKEKSSRKVLMICGPETDKNVAMVEKGFLDQAESYEFEILDTYYASGWRSENIEIYVKENPDIFEEADAIMCGNDNLAGAVVQILSENRRAGQVVVTGQDADLDACQRIVEGTQTSTIYKPVGQMAKMAAELTAEMIEGKDIKETVKDTVENGYGAIPYVGLSPEPVTKDNMDEVIIDSGFHLKEDVYLNVLQ